MKVLIDTNVILDVLTRREPHFEHSAAFLRLCGTRLTGCVAASQTTDIFYVLRREGVEPQAARALLKKLTDNVKVVDTNAADVQATLASDMPDYEDALLACCAERQRAACIVTRNEKDFALSSVRAISPKAFLEQIL